MSIPIALTLLMLYVAKVHSGQESPACPQKKSYPGVLALKIGSEVILGCRGDVTVDSMPLEMSTKQKERLQRRGDVNSQWKSQKARKRIHNPEIENFPTPGELKFKSDRSTSTECEEDNYEEMVEGLRVTRSIKRQAQWTRNGRSIRDGVEYGGALRLPSLQLTDSGNYSCYRRGKLVSSIKIRVGIPPESPTLSCYKKSHTREIRCEWISRKPIIPQPQCYLLLRKGEDDRNVYTAKLCVTNTAGNATSSPYHYIPQNIIKPDPPAQIVVKSVKGEPHMLNISWSLPATWMWELYYTLHFQLRYRPVHAQQVEILVSAVGHRTPDWLISDALPQTDHEIQIRAKDEFEGQWSDWTSPLYAHTYTDPETTVAPDINTSLEPVWIFSEGSGVPEIEVEIRPTDDDGDGMKWMHVLWVMGGFLLITICIPSVYSLRHRMPFMSKKNKECVSSASSCSSPSPFLQQRLMIQRSGHQEREGEGIHLHNVDYFFFPCGPARS